MKKNQSQVQGKETTLGERLIRIYIYEALNRLIHATGKSKNATYDMAMTFGKMSEPLTKVQKVDSTTTAKSYNFAYKYEDSNHPTAPTQIGHDHYTYDANGNPTLVTNDSANTTREMYWDEDNRLMVLSDNGKTSRYTYNAAGERIMKSYGTMEGVYINGAPQGITFHETDNFTLYPASILSVNKNRFTKHYFIGEKRIASRIGTGLFNNVYGRNGSYVTAGQQDYAERMNQIQTQKEAYYKKVGVAPGVPTEKGAYGDPENTGVGYNAVLTELGNHDVPQGWIQTPHPNTTPGTNPGAPVSWNDPSNPDDPQAGYGYIPNDTTKEETFFYHNDHLGSTSYITDDHANITQYDAYLPYGELLVDEHSSSEDMPYKFNGKELDEETGLYYYGARYMDPKISMWLGVDPLTEKYISVSGYVYCIGNPIRFVDPNGCWHWEKNGNLHADRKDNTKTLAQFLGTSQKNVLQILNRNNIKTTKGGNIAVRNLSKLSLDKRSLYTVKADLSGTVLEQTPNLNIVAPESAKGAQQDQLAISHYYFGNGEPADVGDIATNLLINTKTFQDNLKAVTTKVRDKNSFDVDMTALVFHIGKTGVSYAVHPGKQTSHVDFTLFRKPNYVDGFRDPLDLGFELGGTPYDYKARTVTYYFKPVLTTKK